VQKRPPGCIQTATLKLAANLPRISQLVITVRMDGTLYQFAIPGRLMMNIAINSNAVAAILSRNSILIIPLLNQMTLMMKLPAYPAYVHSG
jgi:hypothetical protein